MPAPLYLGIDVGSISINLVALDHAREVVHALYLRGEGSPVQSVQEGLRQLQAALPADAEVSGVGVTGSGRNLVGAVVGADVVKNEITAHARAALHLHPDARTVFEIGGQDSKVTVLRDGAVIDFAMNLVCAAGTGSFLDSQAKRLGITVQQLGQRALDSTSPTTIAGRCTVFAESDMIHKQQVGHRQADIVMGLCQAMVRNFLANVCRGKEIRPPVVFQGGVSANQGIRRAFEETLGYEVLVPRHHMVMGAYGAALIAAAARNGPTRFRGFELSEHAIETSAFVCDDCANTCDIVEIRDNGTLLCRSGGRCDKWEGTVEPPPRPVGCDPTGCKV